MKSSAQSSAFHIYKKDVAFNHINITMSQLATGNLLNSLFPGAIPISFSRLLLIISCLNQELEFIIHFYLFLTVKVGIGGFSMGAAVALYSATCCALGRYGNGIPYYVNLRAVVGLSGWLPGSRYAMISFYNKCFLSRTSHPCRNLQAFTLYPKTSMLE